MKSPAALLLLSLALVGTGCTTQRPRGEPAHLQDRPRTGPDRLDRSLEPAPPRGKARRSQNVSGSTPNHIERRVTPISPRARQTYPFLR